MSVYVLGVDGGGTKTHVAIMDGAGHLLGSGYGGSSNYDYVGVAGASAAISTAVEQARQVANLNDTQLHAAFLGMAGVVSDSDRATIRAIAADLGLAPAEHVGVDHDCRIALAGGLSGRPGIVQIAGTGSSCFGMNTAGESWRAGGWGYLLADEGSSYWLGLEALRATVRAYDGRGVQSTLVAQVRNRLDLADMNDIMRRVYVEEMAPAEIAALAPLVIDAARQLDPIAVSLVRQGARELTECITTVARHLGLDAGPCELALVGGLFSAADVTIPALQSLLAELLPSCRALPAELPPVIGACLLALQSLDITIRPEGMRALRAAMVRGEAALTGS